MQSLSEDELEQAIRIKYGERSIPIVTVATSLMRVLAQQALYVSRLYVAFPEGREIDRQKITDQARSMLEHTPWINGKYQASA